jgi:hypothetical protein
LRLATPRGRRRSAPELECVPRPVGRLTVCEYHDPGSERTPRVRPRQRPAHSQRTTALSNPRCGAAEARAPASSAGAWHLLTLIAHSKGLDECTSDSRDGFVFAGEGEIGSPQLTRPDSFG